MRSLQPECTVIVCCEELSQTKEMITSFVKEYNLSHAQWKRMKVLTHQYVADSRDKGHVDAASYDLVSYFKLLTQND